jgi:hypothetical protein
MGTGNNIRQEYRRRHTSEKPGPATVRRLHDDDAKPFREIAGLLHSNYSAVWRAYYAAPANGTPSSALSTPTTLERTIVIGEPISASLEYPGTPAQDVLVHRVDAHDQRLDVLEAFLRGMQQHTMALQNTSAPSTPQYTTPREWKKSGAEFAVDMPEKLRAYAKAYELQVREGIDMALREFWAAHDAPLPAATSRDEGVRHA